MLGDFAKADSDWLEPLLAEIATHCDLLAEGKDSQFANKLTLTLEPEKAQHKDKPKSDQDSARPDHKPKGQSHIRQARSPKPANLPKSGPMADMLKKLLGGDKS